MAMTASDAEQGSTPTVGVAPLIKTKWYQMAPYNDMVPTIGGKRCPTGCVATAMAQVMKYYKWPMKGTNSIKYDTPDYDQKTCDVDFSQSVYDWDNMLDVYGTRSEPDNFTCSEANRQAVAKLMSDAGAALHMQYATDESGASSGEILSAATYYLGYNSQLYHQNDYSLKQWLSLIKQDLDEGCPLVCCGNADMMRGHCYVLDGYDSNDYLHVNWGWAGDGDGYYSLRNFGTNPNTKFSKGMNFVKMTPNKTGIIEYDPAYPLEIKWDGGGIYSDGEKLWGLNFVTRDVDKLNIDFDINLYAGVWKIYQGDITLGFMPENGEYTPLISLKDVKLVNPLGGPFAGQPVLFHIDSDVIKQVSDGNYLLSIRSKSTPSGMSINGAQVVTAISDATKDFKLIKKNGKVTIGFIEKVAPLIAKSPITLEKNEYDFTDRPSAKIVIANETDEDYSGKPQLIVTDNNNNTTYYGINKSIKIFGGDTKELSFNIPISATTGFSEGTAKISLGQKVEDQIVPLKGIEPTTIKVNYNNDKLPIIEPTELKILVEDNPITDYDNIEFNYNDLIGINGIIKLKVNTAPEYYKMIINFVIALDDGKETIFSLIDADNPKFEEVHKIFRMPDEVFTSDDIGKTGTIGIQYMPMFDTKPRYVQYNGKDLCFKFKIVDPATGIKDVTSGNKASELMRFDVMGNRISAPAKGLNLIKMSDGSVKKVIVK